jgi:hypothetical protein
MVCTAAPEGARAEDLLQQLKTASPLRSRRPAHQHRPTLGQNCGLIAAAGRFRAYRSRVIAAGSVRRTPATTGHLEADARALRRRRFIDFTALGASPKQRGHLG